MSELTNKAKEASEIAETEYRGMAEFRQDMRDAGMPPVGESMDAVVGASITNYKEFQVAELAVLATMTPKEIQLRIQKFKFETWMNNKKAMIALAHLNNLAATLTKEARAELKLADFAYNPKDLATPTKISTRKGTTQTEEEKRAAELHKLMPHMTIQECLEMQRNAKSAAFQKGLAAGAGSPTAIDTCDDCKSDYPHGTTHICPAKAERIAKVEQARAALKIVEPTTNIAVQEHQKPADTTDIDRMLARLQAFRNKGK